MPLWAEWKNMKLKINLKSIFSKKSLATVEIVDKKDEKVANQEVSE